MSLDKRTPAIADGANGFCPGCGHGVVMRLIAEVLEELGQDNNIIIPIGVGCSSLLGGYIKVDRMHVPHGRAGAAATAIKRCNPDNVVLTYQGDGDAYSIGIGETTSAAYRNENISVIVVNNMNYGMTGGQMSSTTMPGQITSTTPGGRDCAKTGMPMKFPELVAHSFHPAYAARGSVHSPANIAKTKEYIKNAIEAQLHGEGYSIVEVLSPCPSNWGMDPMDCMKHIENSIIPYYTLGEFKKRGDSV